MQPFLLVGNSDRARYDFALQVAREQNFHFIPLNAKEFASHEKLYYTATLDDAKCLFYLEDSHKLTIPESYEFIKMIKDSPHRFILSSPLFPNYVLQKQCLVKPLGESLDEIQFALKQLQTNPDRDAVRVLLNDADPIHLFHILKSGAWINQDQLDAMIRISRNLYKVHFTYILDALVFALQAKPMRLMRKPKVDEMQQAILKKLRKILPHYTLSEVADVYHLLAVGGESVIPEKLELTDEEKAYLGLRSKVEQTQEVFVKAVNLEDYF